MQQESAEKAPAINEFVVPENEGGEKEGKSENGEHQIG